MGGLMPERLPRVLVVGGGELGSAVAHRLARSGMTVAVADLEHPKCIRTRVCFATALRLGTAEVEGVTALRAGPGRAGPDLLDEASRIAGEGKLPVFALDGGGLTWSSLAASLGADVVVDARMLKRDQDKLKGFAGLTIGLGPGFSAGEHVDVVIETNRGPDLGRVIYAGCAEPDTGVPAAVAGHSEERVIRAPLAGVFTAEAHVGDMVGAGAVVGAIRPAGPDGAAGRGPSADALARVASPIDGLLRGLVMDGTAVSLRQKIGDVDPRGSGIDFLKISDKGRAVAGGVLEAVMHWWTESHV
jgi:xanthine dehydrogenase accessory factor